MAFDLPAFRARFPEFAPVVDATVQVWLDDSEADLSPEAWGDCYDRAVLYFAAHQLALSQNRVAGAAVGAGGAVVTTGGAGAIASASGGGLSVSFAVPKQATDGSIADAWLLQTAYGQYYLQLRDTCISTGRIAGTVSVGW
jgi:hypothetical protein